MTQRNKAERRKALKALRRTGGSFAYIDRLRADAHLNVKTPADPKRFAKSGEVDAELPEWGAPRSNTDNDTPLIPTTWSSFHGGAHRTLQIDGKGPSLTPYRHEGPTK